MHTLLSIDRGGSIGGDLYTRWRDPRLSPIDCVQRGDVSYRYGEGP